MKNKPDGIFKAAVFITSALRTVLSNIECKSIGRRCSVSSTKMLLFQLFTWFALFNDSPRESWGTLCTVSSYLSDLNYPFIIYSGFLLSKLKVTYGVNLESIKR